jgi:hypothetical protein
MVQTTWQFPTFSAFAAFCTVNVTLVVIFFIHLHRLNADRRTLR